MLHNSLLKLVAGGADLATVRCMCRRWCIGLQKEGQPLSRHHQQQGCHLHHTLHPPALLGSQSIALPAAPLPPAQCCTHSQAFGQQTIQGNNSQALHSLLAPGTNTAATSSANHSCCTACLLFPPSRKRRRCRCRPQMWPPAAVPLLPTGSQLLRPKLALPAGRRLRRCKRRDHGAAERTDRSGHAVTLDHVGGAVACRGRNEEVGGLGVWADWGVRRLLRWRCGAGA